MNREMLSYEIIKSDLRKRFFVKLRDLSITILLIPVANILCLNLIVLLCDPKDSFRIVFSIIFCSFCLALIAYDLKNIIVGFTSIKNEKFEIITDQVVNKEPRVYGSKISSPKPYRLIFTHNSTYEIPYGENYGWSDLANQDDKSLYEFTDIGDVFYVINIGKQKNLMAYNKRFFEFKN